MQENYDNAPGAEALLSLNDGPFTFLRKASAWGITAVKTLFLVIAGFAGLNIFLLLAAIWRTFITLPVTGHNAGYVFLVLLLGIGFTVWAGYWAYSYCLIQVVKFAYTKMGGVVHKISEKIVGFARGGAASANALVTAQPQLTQMVNIAAVITESYPKLPGFVRKGLVFAFNRLPIAPLLNELRSDLLSSTPEDATSKLHARIDDLVLNQFFADGLGWLYWLVPLNLVVQAVIIWWVIK